MELCALFQNVLESDLSTALKPRETDDCCKNVVDECFALIAQPCYNVIYCDQVCYSVT